MLRSPFEMERKQQRLLVSLNVGYEDTSMQLRVRVCLQCLSVTRGTPGVQTQMKPQRGEGIQVPIEPLADHKHTTIKYHYKV